MLIISKEKCLRLAEMEGDHEIGAGGIVLPSMEVERWQLICSAPTSMVILLWALTDTATGNWKMATGYWSSGHETWIWEGLHLKPYDVQPTHWMLLPSPP